MSKRRIPIPPQKRGPDGERLCRWCLGPVPKGRRTFCSKECVHEGMLRSDPGYLRAQTKNRDNGICLACGTDTEAIKLHYLQVAKIASRGIEAYGALRKSASKRWMISPDRLYQITHCQTRADALQENERSLVYETTRWKILARRLEEAGRDIPSRPVFDDRFLKQCRRRLEESVTLAKPEIHALKVLPRLKRLALARRIRIGKELEAAGFRGSVTPQKLQNLWQADHISPVAEGGGGCGLENIQTLCSICHKAKTADQARRSALIRRGINPDAPPEPDPQIQLL